KVGPLSGQQLKTIVAKGQLKPEHLVRRGSEGPWVPAGRVKGLFPEGLASAQPQGKTPPQASAKPLPKAAANPGTPPPAKSVKLPTAAEAPAPPVANIPQDFSLGGHHKHQHQVELNVDRLNIEMTSVTVSRRKVRAGLQGLKKEERKKLTILLSCLIGGGTTIGLIVIIWAAASGKFSDVKPKQAENQPVSAQSSDSGKDAEKGPADKKPVEEKEPENWRRVSVDKMLVDNVEVMVLKPMRGAPTEGARTEGTDVLIVPVNLSLKAGETKEVALTSWMDVSLKKKVSLKDDQNRSHELLNQVAADGSDGKAILPKKRIQVRLSFQAPTGAKPKWLRLELPTAAFHAGGGMIRYVANEGDIPAGAAKSAKADLSTKPGEGDSGKSAPKSDEK
ncbi:MAG: DUF4339 domain-containing protein, partial [Thermoguttaceae bacterium]